MEKLSIIWNVTYKCPWNCKFCVMDAGNNCSKKELSLEEKLRICENIDVPNVRIDLSGGEVMLDKDSHLKLIDELSAKLGKDNVGISSSGFRVNDELGEYLSSRISDFEMTMDAVPGRSYEYREDAYHNTAGKAVKHLKDKGVFTGLQTVLTREHYDHPEYLEELKDWILENKVDEWSLIKYFPSGRGCNYPHLALSDEENLELVERVKNLCSDHHELNLDVHYLLPGSSKSHECRCVKKSIGILPDGNVTACFWGLDGKGAIKDSKFYLGNILEKPLSEILKGENAVYWKKSCGECPLKSGGVNVLF